MTDATRADHGSAIQRIGAAGRLVWGALLWLATRSVPFVILVFLVLLAHSFVSPPAWYFSIDARTDVAELELPGALETSWRIEGAIVCSTARQLGPLERAAGGDAAVCGSRRWHGYRLPGGGDFSGGSPGVAESANAGAGAGVGAAAGDVEVQQVLVLGGPGANRHATIHVAMETRTDGGLQASIRSSDKAPLGVLRLIDQGVELPLPSPLNLIWPANARPRDLVFPFYGEKVRVGRDVTWSDSGMLRSGELTVLTGSEERLGKRAVVEQLNLLPGDQLGLARYADGADDLPKGFLRFDRAQPADDGVPTLAAIAYGRAESIRIERFGDSGYEFRPGWWVGILHHRALAIWSVAMLGLLTVLGGYASIRGIELRLREDSRTLRGDSRESKA